MVTASLLFPFSACSSFHCYSDLSFLTCPAAVTIEVFTAVYYLTQSSAFPVAPNLMPASVYIYSRSVDSYQSLSDKSSIHPSFSYLPAPVLRTVCLLCDYCLSSGFIFLVRPSSQACLFCQVKTIYHICFAVSQCYNLSYQLVAYCYLKTSNHYNCICFPVSTLQ